jgi:hypothetical protein
MESTPAADKAPASRPNARQQNKPDTDPDDEFLPTVHMNR